MAEASRTNFANVFIQMSIRRDSSKPFFGKPFIRYGRLLASAGYSFQVSGVLAAHFRDYADAFLRVFASPKDLGTTIAVMTTEWVQDVMSRLAQGCSIVDFISASEMRTLAFHGNVGDFFVEYGAAKVPLEKSAEVLHGYLMDGIAIGLGNAMRFRDLFQQTYAQRDEGAWARAHAAGLDIPAQQDALTYSECESILLAMFADYCRQMYPELAPSLGL